MTPGDWIARVRLRLELRRWRRLGQRAQLWWRDDDARKPGALLDRLLGAAADLPLALAIVPDGDLAGLAARLRTAPNVTVSQHGVDHRSRSASGSPRSEFAPDADAREVAGQISEARARMIDAGLIPAFFTPPWNEIDERLAEALVLTRYTAVSAAAPARPAPGLVRLDSHVDILRWKDTPRFRGDRRVLGALARQLRLRRRAGAYDAPIGLLSHHLVHDEAAWRFLAWFVGASRRDFAWRSFPDLAQAEVPVRA